MKHTATYSPEDDKIRIYPAYRLDKDTEYARVKSAGFGWAPKQECFYAIWTPEREDVATEMAGEITDDDKSLVQRAEERAERFEDYSDSRKEDAERARKAVDRIADGIPMGQPIMVGHHSERHARRDAAKIENGMRRTVEMWKTAEYWKQRAAGALMAAKYKERPDVRARRIKGIEADLRKTLKTKEQHEKSLEWWSREDITNEKAVFITGHTQLAQFWLPKKEGDREDWHQNCSAYDAMSNHYPNIYAPRTLDEVIEAGRKAFPSRIAHCERWVDHLSNRLEYEHAMLEEQGGSVLLEKKGKSAVASLPLCNYRAPEGLQIENNYNRGQMLHYPQVEMTQAAYAKIYTDYKGTKVVGNSHRVRTAVLHGVPVNGVRHACVFLTDSKIHVPPGPLDKIPSVVDPVAAAQSAVVRAAKAAYREEITGVKQASPPADAAPFKAIEESLKAGVQVVTANQLFPTPKEICKTMADIAEIQPGMRVLEPSAGTGNILEAVWIETGKRCDVAIEINPNLARSLKDRVPAVFCADFLDVIADPMNLFDRILMNPPFENGSDIKHILHAMTFLKPGGRLVAICANGPRQNEKLKPLADTWEELPEGTFAGTGVRTVLLTINNEACSDCGEALGDSESMVRNEGKLSHLGPCNPTLANTEEERQSLLYGGRRTAVLKESKTFDHTRIEASPLFASTTPKLF